RQGGRPRRRGGNLRRGGDAGPPQPTDAAVGRGATARTGGNDVLRSCGVWVALLWTLLIPRLDPQANAAEKAAPVVMGDTFTMHSKSLGETRRITVYLPPGYAESHDARMPVLYMPDGGMA